VQNHTICVLGGTGFVGRHLVSRLAEQRLEIKVLTRRRERHRALQVLPTVKLIEADVHDKAALHSHFQGCNTVINLVGILNEKGHDGSGFRYVHVELARKIVQACRDNDVQRLLHMSALGADAFAGPSHYLRTKGEAEEYVHAGADQNFKVTSFRPAVIFGPEDTFINRFAGLLKIFPILPLACPNTRFAPVYVGDVVDAFAAALQNPSTFGKRYDLCGPRVYTLKALVQYVAKVMGIKRLVVGLPEPLSRLQATVLEYAPGKPFSLDNYHSLSVESVCKKGEPCPTTLESVVPRFLGKD
jgi:uncharacterized protein YbjT (DUF2867 family)